MNGLPLIATPADDELLSSWLDRTAALHGIRRHHLLKWANCSDLKGFKIDGLLSRQDRGAIAKIMRVDEEQIIARTHGSLGPYISELASPERIRIKCAKCAVRLMEAHGDAVKIKQWSEAWRIRCHLCSGILTQSGEEQFTQELKWYWYAPLLNSADRASSILHQKVEHLRASVSQSEFTEHHCPEQVLSSVFPGHILSLFTYLDAKPYKPRARLATISFSTRLFLLAAAGGGTFEHAQHARHLLNVWQENRAVHNRANQKRRSQKVNPSLNNNVNLRLRRTESQIKGV